jgi:hypothetical protein
MQSLYIDLYSECCFSILEGGYASISLFYNQFVKKINVQTRC